jgi:UDP-3-O-[3-hydroxymyristoyl] glucosamine N-acyltransferase
MTVSELAALVGGQLACGADGQAIVIGVASLIESLPGDVTFFSTEKYLPQLHTTKATVALVPKGFAKEVPPELIFCENPTNAFSKLVERFAPAPIVFAPGIHPAALVGADVRLGTGVSVQPYAVIEAGAHIGDGTVVGAHCYIGHSARIGKNSFLHPRVSVLARCVVGDRAILHSGVVLGADGFGYELQEGKFVKVPQLGIVQIDDDVEVGANTTIDRARFGRTWIQSGTKIDNLVQIGHNVVIGTKSIICGQVGVSGSTKIGSYVTIAGQAGIGGHIEIADQATVAAQSGVTKTLSTNQIYMGFPAMPARQFKEDIAHLRNIPRLKARIAKIEQLLSAENKSLPPEI